MRTVPVPFPSLSAAIVTASRFCGRDGSVISMLRAKRELHAGDKLQLEVRAPELKTLLHIEAQVVARTYRPNALKVRYRLPDLSQMEAALAQLYQGTTPALPMALDVVTAAQRRCRLSSLSAQGATFDFAGSIGLPARAHVDLELPHQSGRVDLPCEVSQVLPSGRLSRLQVHFTKLPEESLRRLEDIVFRFRLGQAPWTPRLMAAGL